MDDNVFKNIGYINRTFIDNWEIYTNNEKFTEIIFDHKHQSVCCNGFEDDGIFITMQELDTIYQKCKDLGWM